MATVSVGGAGVIAGGGEGFAVGDVFDDLPLWRGGVGGGGM